VLERSSAGVVAEDCRRVARLSSASPATGRRRFWRKLVVNEQLDELVEQPVQVVSVGQLIVLVHDPVVGQAHRRDVRLTAAPDRDFDQPN
jgi:hypothetical protein